MPVTPTHGESPLSGRTFGQVVPYELGQEGHDSYNGLPSAPKPLIENPYGSWLLGGADTSISTSNVNHGAQGHGDLFNAHIAQQVDSFETSMGSSVNAPWDSWSNIANTSRQWNDHASSFGVPEGAGHPFWPDHMHLGQTTHLVTLPQSASMTDVEEEYVHVGSPKSMANMDNEFVNVGSPYFSESGSYEDLGSSFPQSPQEVHFKQEPSPSPAKQESDMVGRALVLEPLIYESPTGGKSFRREQKTQTRVKRGRISKRTKGVKKDNSKLGRLISLGGGASAFLKEENFCGGEWDAVKKCVKIKERCEAREQHACVVCGRLFRRQEHKARHERSTHGIGVPDNAVPDYPCQICQRSFNRYDNLVAHWQTHIIKPSSKGRNLKYKLEEVQAYFADPKVQDKIGSMYRTFLTNLTNKDKKH